MALKDSASAPVVRPSWNDAVEIKRLLDAGFYNFLVPFVQTVDDARRAVAATRYPPAGIRGVSVSQRSNRYRHGRRLLRATSTTQISVMVQIESRAGLDGSGRRSRRSTASTASSSARRISPPRSATSAMPNHAERAGGDRRRSSTAAKTAGKPIGILAPVEADARRYLALGATFVAVGSDLGVFRSATQQLRDRYARSG